MKRPLDTADMSIDFYFEQFSEPGDKPTITVYNYDECYEFHHSASPAEIKQEIARIRKDAAWLLRSAEYIEQKLTKKSK